MIIVLAFRSIEGKQFSRTLPSAQYAYGYIDGLCEMDVISSPEHSRMVEEIESWQGEIDANAEYKHGG